MKTDKLMKYDYVLNTSNGKPVQVKTSKEDSIITVDDEEIRAFLLEPISITDRLLDILGFEKNYWVDQENLDNFLDLSKSKNGYWMLRIESKRFSGRMFIDYLHELQNIINMSSLEKEIKIPDNIVLFENNPSYGEEYVNPSELMINDLVLVATDSKNENFEPMEIHTIPGVSGAGYLIKPIQITKEFLSKNGFSTLGGNFGEEAYHYKLDGGSSINLYFKEKGKPELIASVNGEENYCDGEIRYVHELQHMISHGKLNFKLSL